MELKKDWSLAYFLFYICQIGYWLIVFNVATQILLNSLLIGYDPPYIHDIPVNMEIEEFEGYREIELDEANVNLPSRVEAMIGIKGSFNEYPSAFLYYNGLKMYKAAVFFIVLFFFAKVLKSVAEGNPFAANNPKYLYIIGWTLFLSSVINIGIGYLPLPVLDGVSLPVGYDFSSVHVFRDYMMEGIFIIVLGYVFKEGTRIYEEQKLTV